MKATLVMTGAVLAAVLPLLASDSGCIVEDNSTDERYTACKTVAISVCGTTGDAAPAAMDLRAGTCFTVFPFLFSTEMPALTMYFR